MFPFEYTNATDVSSALALVAYDASTRYLAGGTTLIDLMKLDVERPTRVVNVNGLGFTKIDELPSGGLRIGALVRNSDLAQHPLVRSRFPVLSQALLAGASPQLRNMATTGGNLLQRTRCYYFRDSAMPCNKREPGSGCSALGGYNRIHAVLGTSESCIATHPSDLCVALAMLEAVVRVRGAHGEREIAFANFHRLPGDAPHVETTLEPGELITAVDVPPLAFARRSLYRKMRDRASYAFALASAAVALDIVDSRVLGARVALGGVGTVPWRSTAAEGMLVGRPATSDTYRAAADAALDGAVPRAHNAFKIDLAKRTLMQTLARVAAMDTADAAEGDT